MLEAASNTEPGQVGEYLSKVAHSPASLRACFVVALLEGEDSVVEVGPAVAQWVEEILASPQHRQHRRVLKCLCSIPPHLLSKALARYTQLIMAVMKCLHQEVLNLQPKYDAGMCCWLPRGASVLCWEDVVKTYGALTSQQSMATSVQEAVEEWSMLEGGAAWVEVIRQTKVACLPASSSTSDS